MTREEIMDFIDRICEEYGYMDSPAYDLFYSECMSRSDEDAKEMIEDLLASYNSQT